MVWSAQALHCFALELGCPSRSDHQSWLCHGLLLYVSRGDLANKRASVFRAWPFEDKLKLGTLRHAVAQSGSGLKVHGMAALRTQASFSPPRALHERHCHCRFLNSADMPGRWEFAFLDSASPRQSGPLRPVSRSGLWSALGAKTGGHIVCHNLSFQFLADQCPDHECLSQVDTETGCTSPGVGAIVQEAMPQASDLFYCSAEDMALQHLVGAHWVRGFTVHQEPRGLDTFPQYPAIVISVGSWSSFQLGDFSATLFFAPGQEMSTGRIHAGSQHSELVVHSATLRM
jgi:hypothetical protein